MKLTDAQRHILARMGTGADLRNGDEGTITWWLMPGFVGVHPKSARALVSKGYVEYCAKWGGDPGVLGYRITPAGRAALQGRD